MRTRICARFFLFWLLFHLAGAAPAIPGQQPEAPAQQPDEPPITLGAELVVLDVSVTDKNGRPVGTIPKEHFQVFEDGAPQEIEFFSRGEAPASIVLALDASGSMRQKIKNVTEAAARVLSGARPGDEFAVVEFREEAFVIEEFTSDPVAVRDALSGLEPFGQTAMIDAAYLSAEYAQREGRNQVKAVVLVTDGVDKNSFYTFDQLAEHFRRLNVRFYAIGFTADLDTDRGLFQGSEKARSEKLLTRLAKETGGMSFFPARLEELSGINDAIAGDLRSVYSIGYYPKNTKRDGTYRAVSVRVLGSNGRESSGLAVRTRAGYIAGRS